MNVVSLLLLSIQINKPCNLLKNNPLQFWLFSLNRSGKEVWEIWVQEDLALAVLKIIQHHRTKRFASLSFRLALTPFWGFRQIVRDSQKQNFATSMSWILRKNGQKFQNLLAEGRTETSLWFVGHPFQSFISFKFALNLLWWLCDIVFCSVLARAFKEQCSTQKSLWNSCDATFTQVCEFFFPRKDKFKLFGCEIATQKSFYLCAVL